MATTENQSENSELAKAKYPRFQAIGPARTEATPQTAPLNIQCHHFSF